MTATSCQSGGCNGFYRGTANLGWAGSKLFVVTFNMPPSQDPTNFPAMWVLNGQVVRAAQYGCNCRGMGGNGGCGEVDVLEDIGQLGVGATARLHLGVGVRTGMSAGLRTHSIA